MPTSSKSSTRKPPTKAANVTTCATKKEVERKPPRLTGGTDWINSEPLPAVPYILPDRRGIGARRAGKSATGAALTDGTIEAPACYGATGMGVQPTLSILPVGRLPPHTTGARSI